VKLTQITAGQIKFAPGFRQVVATITTEVADRSGDIVRASGCDYSGFLASKAILWNHDASMPIAKCLSIRVGTGMIESIAQFPPPGDSDKADEIYNLIHAGVINATSIGFLPTKTEPIKNGPRGALEIIKWTLLEWSFVSVPANDQALITQRAMGVRHQASDARVSRMIDLVRLGGSPNAEIMKQLPSDKQRRIRAVQLANLRNHQR
jgi:HK97 family phage prohead protease